MKQYLKKLQTDIKKPETIISILFNIGIILVFLIAIFYPKPEITIVQTNNGYCQYVYDKTFDEYCLIYNETLEGYIILQNKTNVIT